jgi:hypothetical protein
MQYPRERVARSGSARQRVRALTLAVVAFTLALSACGPDTKTTGVNASWQLQAVEAEDAAVLGDTLTVIEVAGASGGKALGAAEGFRPATVPSEDAIVTFTVPAAGRYVLWARVMSTAAEGSSAYAGFDGTLELIETPRPGEWVWVPVDLADLEAGEHAVSLGAAEPDTIIDAVVVTSRRDLGQEDLEAFLIGGVMPGQPPAAEPEGPGTDKGPKAGAPTVPAGQFDLRGDPDFDVSKLPADAQVWYRRLWTSIDDSIYDAYDWAKSDNLYKYARDLHTHVQFLLHAFRATGDLKLLDEIDYIAEIMRSKLADSWRDVREGSASPGKDGYLNWVWRASGADQYYGKDDHQLDEIKTHALIASVAWALEVNRDLKSPGGRDYAEHADFWKDYLKNHFEAKWRERMKKPAGFPIMIRPHTHTYYSWTKWHYYMALLTGDDAYMKEAQRMASVLEDEMVPVKTDNGTAFVWTRSVRGEGGKEEYLHPNVYARYVYHDVVEFYFEGFAWWDEDALAAIANTFATWVIDPKGAKASRDWFTGDIGGDKSRGGIATDGWNRMDYYRYEASAFAEIAPWDSTRQIDAMTDRVLDQVGDPAKPRYLALPTAKLIDALVN